MRPTGLGERAGLAPPSQWPPDLLRNRRPDGLHSRRRALPGGRPIITLFSRAMGQQGLASRHPPTTRAGMVTARGDVHGVITGYARSILDGETLRERGEALVSIAHPDFCAELLRDLAQIRHFTLSQG